MCLGPYEICFFQKKSVYIFLDSVLSVIFTIK